MTSKFEFDAKRYARAVIAKRLSAADGVAAVLRGAAEIWHEQAAEARASAKRGAKGYSDSLAGAAIRAIALATEVEQAYADILTEQLTSTPAPADALDIPPGASEQPNIVEDIVQPIGMPAILDPVTTGAPARLSWAALMTPVSGEQRAAHRSFSQISQYADCPLKYRIERYHGGDAPSRPAWWNVGGTAFHACAEAIEHEKGASASLVDRNPLALWLNVFSATIEKTERESGVSPALWSAANKGAEGYDWWRVQGAEMVRRYLGAAVNRSARWAILRTHPDGAPVIECKLTLDVEGIPVVVVIDQAWLDTATGSVDVVDLKTGSSQPADALQLAIGAYALRRDPDIARAHGWVGADVRFTGTYYDARKGQHGEQVDLFARHPWDEIVYRVHSMDAAERAGAYPPRVSSFCAGCSVRDACPTRG